MSCLGTPKHLALFADGQILREYPQDDNSGFSHGLSGYHLLQAAKNLPKGRRDVTIALVVLHRLFIFCSIVSLLLCVAVCVLWARSYSWYDRVMWAGREEYRRVQSLNGRLVFELTTDDPLENQSGVTSEPVGDDLRGLDWAVGLAGGWTTNDDLVDWRLGSFAYAASSARYSQAQPNATRVRMLVVPHWALAGASAVLSSTILVPAVRRLRRRRRGHCPDCGYDLRATPERCPECGRSSPQTTALPANAADRAGG